jgi:hypothetical protein
MRSPPSMKVSVMATGGITKKAATGTKNWFERGQLPLSFSVQKNKLLYSSARNMTAIKHNMKSAYANNTKEAAALAPLAVMAMSTKSLKLLGTLHLEALQRLMAKSARRRPEMRLEMYKPKGGGNDQLALESRLIGK